MKNLELRLIGPTSGGWLLDVYDPNVAHTVEEKVLKNFNGVGHAEVWLETVGTVTSKIKSDVDDSHIFYANTTHEAWDLAVALDI